MRSISFSKYNLACTAIAVITITISTHARANDYSSTLYGPLGLNTVPNARMDETGTVRAGVSTLDPYIHSWLGIQLAEPLSITVRQSAEISNLNDDADRLYPGADLKLRLMKETKTLPELSVGLQSAIGHKRLAGEYLALSKRYKDFDFTAGLGWGRYGSAAHFDNPLKILGSHFGKNRSLDGEMPNQPHDWFTGQDIGVFGGLEYFTPLKGLSVKLDYGADHYIAEQADTGFARPAPWSAGLNYKPASWIALGIAAQGNDKLMGRLSLQSPIKNWRDKDHQTRTEKRKPFRPYRTGLSLPSEMELAAAGEEVQLYDVETTLYNATGSLTLNEKHSTPRQIGHAAKHIANHAGPAIERIEIQPVKLGLYGPAIQIMRSGLENALGKKSGSAEEIWHSTEFLPLKKGILTKRHRPFDQGYGLKDVSFKLDTQISLSEEDSGTLHRTGIVIGSQAPEAFGFLDSFASFRINTSDNLDRLSEIRPRPALPVKSDIDLFTRRTIALDTAFSAFTHSFRSDLHMSLMGGYLEEMYGGAGGEVLYRPFDARWAIGAESFLAFKRDPETSLNMGYTGDSLLSGHVNGWYDIPEWDLTLNAKIGRYLAEDIGGTLSLQKRFHNGAKLEGYMTMTNQSDLDLFGGTTHADHGIRLSLPLGGFKYAPERASANITLAPFGRDIGQKLENPLPLYDVTESFSARHMAKYWNDITE